MSRPIKFGQPANLRLQVRLTPEQRAELERVAEQNRCTLVDVFRDAINSYCDDFRDRDPVFCQPKRTH